MNVLITGAAGYIGTMLIERLARSDSIDKIYGLDMRERPPRCDNCDKLSWIRADVSEDGWIEQIDRRAIDVVVSGHSHVPKVETKQGVLFLNPGSAGPRRFKLPITLAMVDLSLATLQPKIYRLMP